MSSREVTQAVDATRRARDYVESVNRDLPEGFVEFMDSVVSALDTIESRMQELPLPFEEAIRVPGTVFKTRGGRVGTIVEEVEFLRGGFIYVKWVDGHGGEDGDGNDMIQDDGLTIIEHGHR